ncbi:DUF2510 domain-containing protein [Mycobacterium sp. 21AC1]|uniref:DUF2510 domain-containing protein n=1 Tax=[Mycobacterium] appelbergii TaxID=2939269 RepID=UPI002938DE51|nr:DUF2510 domain-containing protein [Mycobacterium sp. 21AC1]MDV3130168.1 DUF2510 domain-containing protein [Mycobacterium sp. 21AC1]
MTDQNAPAPGWYPDPGGQPGQRYHDGRRWTQHFAPTPPAVPPPPPAQAVAVAVSAGGGPNHAVHLILTLLTCGLWLPVWILVALFGGSSSSVAVSTGAGGIARVSNRRPLMVAAVFGGLVLLGTASEHPWLFVVFAVLGILAGAGFWALKSAQAREEQQRQEQFQRDMLANRADYEDQLYQEGDPRGTHGRYLPPESP